MRLFSAKARRQGQSRSRISFPPNARTSSLKIIYLVESGLSAFQRQAYLSGRLFMRQAMSDMRFNCRRSRMRKKIPERDVSAARLHVSSGVVPPGRTASSPAAKSGDASETPCSARDGDGGSARIVTCRDVARQRGRGHRV